MTTWLFNRFTNIKLGGLLNNPNFPDGQHRPDLSNRSLGLVLAAIGLIAPVVIKMVEVKPGSILGQTAAAIGGTLLLTPLMFSLLKRSQNKTSPNLWFCIHVLATSLGFVLICFHVAKGNWFTPPGIIFWILSVLIIQGFISRIFITKKISYLFAKSVSSFNFTQPVEVDKSELKAVINSKINLLKRLDNETNEALFSLRLSHWFKQPILSFKYQQLVTKESRLVGARSRAGWVLRTWRRIHILLACIFLTGLVAHVIVMLFFAGYAAQGTEIDWWYITAWGAK